MIVKTIKHGECVCHFDDSAYAEKTEEEIKAVINRYSEFIASCLLKEKTA